MPSVTETVLVLPPPPASITATFGSESVGKARDLILTTSAGLATQRVLDQEFAKFEVEAILNTSELTGEQFDQWVAKIMRECKPLDYGMETWEVEKSAPEKPSASGSLSEKTVYGARGSAKNKVKLKTAMKIPESELKLPQNYRVNVSLESEVPIKANVTDKDKENSRHKVRYSAAIRVVVDKANNVHHDIRIDMTKVDYGNLWKRNPPTYEVEVEMPLVVDPRDITSGMVLAWLTAIRFVMDRRPPRG